MHDFLDEASINSKFLRHDLVWLAADALNSLLPQWDLNYPFVVTRQSELVPSDMLSIACSMSADKSCMSRRNFTVPLSAISKHSRPLLFEQVLPEFGLLHLNQTLLQFARDGIVVRVYGSMAWQYLTKRNYFLPNSDIDLLFEVKSNYLDNTILHNLILHLQSLVSYTIDGELLFLNGNFIAWREWFNSENDVLVKTTTKVMMMSKRAIIISDGRH